MKRKSQRPGLASLSRSSIELGSSSQSHLDFSIQVTAFIAEEVSWVRGNDVLRRAYNHDAILPSECDAFVASCLPVPLAAFLSVHLASKGNLDLANGVVDLLRGCDAEANRLAGAFGSLADSLSN